MTDKLKSLFIKYREIIMYLIFGVLTTLVSFASYYLLLFFDVHYIVSQAMSWLLAVVFAFVVNKRYVFLDANSSPRILLRQLWQFFGVRIASGLIETALLWLMVGIINIGEGIAKIPVAVITVIINYIASKLIIFAKK